MWLDAVKQQDGNKLQVQWRGFLLEQANNKQGPDWKLWEQPSDYPFRSLPALRAAEAARLQDSDAFYRFHIGLLKARHEEHKNITDRDVLTGVARSAGLDPDQMHRDAANQNILEKIVSDHTEAVEQFGVFGTPTFVFPNGSAAFLKLLKPPDNDASDLLDLLSDVMGNRAYVGEIKRPQPPWPRNANMDGN
jgi:hypothetical protein